MSTGDEHFNPGAVIETTEATLRNEAQAAHRAWFAEPTSTPAKESFAAKLKRWGRYTRSKRAVDHALTLEAECLAAELALQGAQKPSK